MDKLLQIHKFDNVAVALENIAIGEFSAVNPFALADGIPFPSEDCTIRNIGRAA